MLQIAVHLNWTRRQPLPRSIAIEMPAASQHRECIDYCMQWCHFFASFEHEQWNWRTEKEKAKSNQKKVFESCESQPIHRASLWHKTVSLNANLLSIDKTTKFQLSYRSDASTLQFVAWSNTKLKLCATYVNDSGWFVWTECFGKSLRLAIHQINTHKRMHRFVLIIHFLAGNCDGIEMSYIAKTGIFFDQPFRRSQKQTEKKSLSWTASFSCQHNHCGWNGRMENQNDRKIWIWVQN